MVLRGDAFSSILSFDVFVKIFWKISTKVYNSDNKCLKFIKGAFLCAGTAFMAHVEHKLGLEEWERFR